jgi:glycosyltransferase involved in cell wall biosynthesis
MGERPWCVRPTRTYCFWAFMQIAHIKQRPFGCVRLAGEGLGPVFLETIAPGEAVVGGNHGGIPDIIQDGVADFPVSRVNMAQLTGRLRLLVTNESLLENMGRGDPRESAEIFLL